MFFQIHHYNGKSYYFDDFRQACSFMLDEFIQPEGDFSGEWVIMDYMMRVISPNDVRRMIIEIMSSRYRITWSELQNKTLYGIYMERWRRLIGRVEDNYPNRGLPVPRTGRSRRHWWNQCRYPRHLQYDRYKEDSFEEHLHRGEDDDVDWVLDNGIINQLKRPPRHYIPNAWDDETKASCYNRNWKQFRKTRYHPH